MLTSNVPHWAVRGMLWNCLFPAQFPEFWDTDIHAEMDVGLREFAGRQTKAKTKTIVKWNGGRFDGFDFIRNKIMKET